MTDQKRYKDSNMGHSSPDPDYQHDQTLRTTKVDSGRNNKNKSQTQPLVYEYEDSYSHDEMENQTEGRVGKTTDEHPATTQQTCEQTSDKEVQGDEDDYDEYINAENEEIKATINSPPNGFDNQMGEIARMVQQTESDG